MSSPSLLLQVEQLPYLNWAYYLSMYLYRFPFRVALFVRQHMVLITCVMQTHTSPNDSDAIIWSVNGHGKLAPYRSRRNYWVSRRANQSIKPLIRSDNNERQIIWCRTIKFGVNDSRCGLFLTGTCNLVRSGKKHSKVILQNCVISASEQTK